MERGRRWVFVFQWFGESKDHFVDCYFCMTKISGFSKKTKSKIIYPNCDSEIKPIPHSSEYPVPEPPSVLTTYDSESEQSTDAETSSASEFEDSSIIERTFSDPHVFSQGDLQDLVRDLNSSKEKSKIFAS